jgi:hypothetical protein
MGRPIISAFLEPSDDTGLMNFQSPEPGIADKSLPVTFFLWLLLPVCPIFSRWTLRYVSEARLNKGAIGCFQVRLQLPPQVSYVGPAEWAQDLAYSVRSLLS